MILNVHPKIAETQAGDGNPWSETGVSTKDVMPEF
jgi:hypothetical protein